MFPSDRVHLAFHIIQTFSSLVLFSARCCLPSKKDSETDVGKEHTGTEDVNTSATGRDWIRERELDQKILNEVRRTVQIEINDYISESCRSSEDGSSEIMSD